jgi:hypothetical protein
MQLVLFSPFHSWKGFLFNHFAVLELGVNFELNFSRGYP